MGWDGMTMTISRHAMRTRVLATGLALATSLCRIPQAIGEDADTALGRDTATRGSPDFYPSPEHPVGWRGDGSGHYPAANPPLRWGRAAATMKLLRSQAARPREGETGKPIPDGVIREWLILGPVPVTNALKKIDVDKDVLPDEAKMEPNEGDKIGDLTWQKVSPDSQTIDFRTLFATQSVAYACAYVCSESKQSFNLHIMSSGHRLLLNGIIQKDGPVVVVGTQPTLEKGWNRLLFRVQREVWTGYGSGPDRWYLRCTLYGDGGPTCKYETENITWISRLPGWGISTPIIVGDKIFVTTNKRSLCCLNKSDGRLLWMRTITLYDTATEDEKMAAPEVFREIAPLAAQLTEIDRSVKPDGVFSNEIVATKEGIEDKIDRLMLKVDAKKYALSSSGEAGYCGPTPASDGRYVYVSYPIYLAACFDFDGNVRWKYMRAGTPPWREHCFVSSPVLSDGKLIVPFGCLFALDAATGKPAWESRVPGVGFPSLITVTTEKEPLVMTPENILRVRDGKELSCLKLSPGNFANCIGTPVRGDGGKVFRIETTQAGKVGTTLQGTIRLPPSPNEPFNAELTKNLVLDARDFPCWYSGWYSASPLYHEGLLYCLSEDGVLSVVDTEKQELVYRKLLDLDLFMCHSSSPARGGACASPALAGKYIYFFGNRGTCVVIKPGRTFRQVARHRIETPWETSWRGSHPEQTISCPVFEGKRLYYRGMENLYCIEEK